MLSRPANRSGSRSASICARQPRGQQPCRFVRGPSVEWHQRASGSGDPHDVGSPAVWRNRRNLDDIRPSRDGFFEAMHDVGHQSRCDIILLLGASFSPATRRVSSEGIHEGAANASMRVGFASGTRPGPPIEERKSCERGRLKAPPRREGEAGPLTLLTDWSTRLIALYLPSRHEVAVVLIILLVPPPVASVARHASRHLIRARRHPPQ